MQALTDIGSKSRGDSHSHREHDNRRKLRQVSGRDVNEEVIEQIGLLVGLEPLIIMLVEKRFGTGDKPFGHEC